MAYVVDRVVICDAFQEPDQHYQLLPGRQVEARRGSPALDALPRLGQGREGWHRRRRRQGGRALRGPARLATSRRTTSSTSSATRCARGARPATRARRSSRGGSSSGGSSATRSARRSASASSSASRRRSRPSSTSTRCRGRRKMPETGDLLRYALKLATGTGKTVVMALFVTWSTLHKRKVSGSSLSANFLVLVPEPHGARPGERRTRAVTGSTRPASTTSTTPSRWCRPSTGGVPARTCWCATGRASRSRRSATTGSARTSAARGGAVHPAVGAARDAAPRAAGPERADPPTARRLARPRRHQRRGAPRLRREAHAGRARTPSYIKWSKILERISQGRAGEPRDRPLGDALVRLRLAQARGDALRVAGLRLLGLRRLRVRAGQGRAAARPGRAGARLPRPVGPGEGRQDQGGVPARLQGRDREHLLVVEEGPRRVGEHVRVRCARAEPRAALRDRQRAAGGVALRAPDPRVRAAAQPGRRGPHALGDDPDRLEGLRRRQGQRGRAARDGQHRRLEGASPASTCAASSA